MGRQVFCKYSYLATNQLLLRSKLVFLRIAIAIKFAFRFNASCNFRFLGVAILRFSQHFLFVCLDAQVKLRHADQEIRLAQDPFPLYPGEALKQVVTQLKVVPANTALRLRAVLDFQADKTRRVAGDEWLFEGPGMFCLGLVLITMYWGVGIILLQ